MLSNDEDDFSQVQPFYTNPMDEFMTEVNDLCSAIEFRIDYINAGGCAVFAAFMGQCLMRYGIVRIAVADDDELVRGINLNKVRKQVENNSPNEWHSNDVRFGHVIVEFKYKGHTYHIDSTGVNDKSKFTAYGGYKLFAGRLTVQEVTELASHEEWNPTFERGHIPEMKDMFDTGFASMFKRGYVPLTR